MKSLSGIRSTSTNTSYMSKYCVNDSAKQSHSIRYTCTEMRSNLPAKHKQTHCRGSNALPRESLQRKSGNDGDWVGRASLNITQFLPSKGGMKITSLTSSFKKDCPTCFLVLIEFFLQERGKSWEWDGMGEAQYLNGKGLMAELEVFLIIS